jgi:hypothetical protein
MSDTSWRGGAGGMSPERLQSYADSGLRARKIPQEVEEELMELGLDREAAAARPSPRSARGT